MQSHIGDINAPYLIGMIHRQALEQIGKTLMFRGRNRGPRLGIIGSMPRLENVARPALQRAPAWPTMDAYWDWSLWPRLIRGQSYLTAVGNAPTEKMTAHDREGLCATPATFDGTRL